MRIYNKVHKKKKEKKKKKKIRGQGGKCLGEWEGCIP
jgi:hypothetical protein